MKKKKKSSMEDKMFRQYLVLVLPGFIIFTIGLIIPLLLSFRYSLTSWDGMTAEKPFVGLKNYIDLIHDKDFRDTWWFTIKFTIGNTIIQNVAALLFAVALDSGINLPYGIFCSVSDQCCRCRLYLVKDVFQCASGTQ